MNPYVIIGLLIAWALSLAGVGAWQNDAGHTAERAAWQERENTELLTANAEIERLSTKARDDEADHAKRLSKISTDYEKRLEDAKTQRDRDVADAHAGALRLRFNTAGKGAGSNTTGETGSGAGRCDGAASGELPREVVADLFALVGDANAVALQLAGAQKVIEEDRRLCGASTPSLISSQPANGSLSKTESE